jgi:uncharacterized membrane protein YhiD involved in acid resistance
MPDWIYDSFQADKNLSLTLLATRLTVAFALGCVVGAIYRLTHSKSNEHSALQATLVLLTILICMVTLAIGNSLPRAFGLVGALSIVRFRTVVEDTRDTAFVIFAVAVGMAVGAGALAIPLIGIPFTAVAAFVFRPHGNGLAAELDGKLRVRLTLGGKGQESIAAVLAAHVAKSRLVTTATARQGSALDLTYEVRLRHTEAAVPLVSELNRCEGVQEVEFRQG